MNTLVLTIVCCDVAGLPSNLPLPNLGEGFEQEQSTIATSPRAYLEVIIYVCCVETHVVEITKYLLAREK